MRKEFFDPSSCHSPPRTSRSPLPQRASPGAQLPQGATQSLQYLHPGYQRLLRPGGGDRSGLAGPRLPALGPDPTERRAGAGAALQRVSLGSGDRRDIGGPTVRPFRAWGALIGR